MSVHNKFIKDIDAVPKICSDIFHESPRSQFATINLGYGLYPIGTDEDIYQAYLRLRKNVYVDQTGMLDQSVVNPDGTEHDIDDVRSNHFAIVQNKGVPEADMVACMRLIIKEDDQNLPFEDFYPGALPSPAPKKSFEVSRFISKVPHRAHQLGSIASLFTVALAFSDRHNLGPAYGVVEEELERSLGFFGAPPTRIAEPKILPEYNDVNVGIEINQEAMKRQIGVEVLRKLPVSQGDIIFWGEKPDKSKVKAA